MRISCRRAAAHAGLGDGTSIGGDDGADLSAGGERTPDGIGGRREVDRTFEAAEHRSQALGQILCHALDQKNSTTPTPPARHPVRAHELAVENSGSGPRPFFFQYHVRPLVRMGLFSGASLH
jgi:hypothetical protein